MNADLSACASSGRARHANQINWIECRRTVRRLQASIVKATCLVAWSGSAHAGLRNGLSRMRRKSHVRF
jgi:hypothetical protein